MIQVLGSNYKAYTLLINESLSHNNTPESKFEDVPEEVLTDPTMRTALGMDPIPGMNTPVDEPTIFTNSSSSSTATPEVKVFKNPVHPEFGDLRVIEISDELWFVGKEVAEILGYKDTAKALRVHVDGDDRRLVKVDEMATLDIKSNYGLTIINESGLYSLILSSKLPSAKDFKHWVTSEVLPSIRKNGAYIRNQENMTPAEIVARGLIAAQGKDVATALGYCNINKAVAAHVDEDDKKVLDFKGFSQNRKSSGLWVGHDFSSKTIINGKDVAAALGYTNSRDAIATHVFADDKGVESIDTLGGRQKMTIINESGLYALVFGSRLKIAKEFKHWVTSEVLPYIRKNGAYIRNQENMTPAEIVARGLIAAQKIIEEREQDHSTQPLSAVTCSY